MLKKGFNGRCSPPSGDQQAGWSLTSSELVDQGFQSGRFVAKQRDETGGVIDLRVETQVVDLAQLVQPDCFIKSGLALKKIGFVQQTARPLIKTRVKIALRPTRRRSREVGVRQGVAALGKAFSGQILQI